MFNATSDMLYEATDVQVGTIVYINSFLQNASYSNYSPHITVGNGTYQGNNFPISFTFQTLAICQLGNHCTCSKILYAANLTE